MSSICHGKIPIAFLPVFTSNEIEHDSEHVFGHRESLTWRVTMVGPWANDIFQAAWGMFRDPTHPRALQKRKLNEMLSILRRRSWADALVAASISVIFNIII
jgi:hypothetical protein